MAETRPLFVHDSGASSVAAVDHMLRDWDDFIADIWDQLLQAREAYKRYYDANHRDLVFQPGDWVWLRLLSRPAASLGIRSRSKLSPKFYGPYQVLSKIGDVAYKLQLSSGACLHDVFHVSLLKPYRGDPPSSVPPFPPVHDGHAIPTPTTVLRVRLSRGVREVLVQWQGLDPAEASWVPLDEFRRVYLTF